MQVLPMVTVARIENPLPFCNNVDELAGTQQAQHLVDQRNKSQAAARESSGPSPHSTPDRMHHSVNIMTEQQ